MAEVEEDTLCTQCEEVLSQWKCQECNIGLCNKCQKGHLKIPVCQNHKAIPIEKRNGNKLNPPICEKHNEPITLNCATCDRMICVSCKRGDHKDHMIENLSKAFDKLLQKFQVNGEKVDNDLIELQEKVNLINTNIDSIRTLYLACKESVGKRADDIVKAVERDKEELQSNLDQRQAEEITKLETLKEQTENDMKGCAQIKNVIDTKKAALMTNVWTDLKCEDDPVQLEALDVEKIVLNNPNFTPADDNSEQMSTNRVGTIEFKDIEVKLKTRERTNGIGLPHLLRKDVQVEKEISIPSGSSFHFGIVDNDLWVPIHGEDTIMVFTNSGERRRHINVSRNQDTVWGMKSPRTWQNGLTAKSTSLSAPRAVEQVNKNTLVIAADTGVYLMDTAGKVQSQLESGQFCDISFNKNSNKLASLDYGSKKCYIFKYDMDENKWMKEDEFIPRKCKVDQYGSILLTNQCVVICPGGTHIVQKYSFDGESLQEYGSYGRGEPGQLWGPSLCACDSYVNILIADVNNKRLQVLDKNNKWIVVYLQDLTYPFDVKLADNGIWVLSQQNGSKYKLIKYMYLNE